MNFIVRSLWNWLYCKKIKRTFLQTWPTLSLISAPTLKIEAFHPTLFSVWPQGGIKGMDALCRVYEKNRENSNVMSVICVRGWLLLQRSRCCPSASCRFGPHPLQIRTHLGYTAIITAWIIAGLDDQTHKHRSNYHLYSIYDRNCKAATVYENKRPFPEQLREDTLVTPVTNGTVFSSFFFFYSYF